MPLYEYSCRACGHRFDKLVGLQEADRRPACPACGSERTEKQFSTFAAGGGESCGGPAGRSPFS